MLSQLEPTVYERRAPDPRVVEASLADTEPSVYWLQEAPGAVAYPQLTSAIRADLLVVGGGYAGLWTAVQAKRRDPAAVVVLVEAQTVGWAASGRNGGFCEASLTHGEENGRSRWPDEYDELEKAGQANLEAIARDVDELGIDCQFERTGTLTAAVEQHQLAWLGDLPDQVRLDATQVRAEIDSPIFLGGAWHRDDAALVQPGRLARELARVASDLGVVIFEHTEVLGLDGARSGPVRAETPRAYVQAERVALATNVFTSLLRRNRLMTVPVYDYVLVTEPLDADQMRSIGWQHRQGLTDMANQFHYSRLTADDRIMFGGYDAIYHRGRAVRSAYEDRPASYRRLASHFFTTFPQLEGVGFTHRWGGAIDTSTQFTAFYGLARQGRVAYAAGFTGLGVGATRFAADVMLDKLAGLDTERTRLELTRHRPLPFPPEPIASLGINLTRWSLDRADHRQGRRNPFLKALDAVGLGFDS